MSAYVIFEVSAVHDEDKLQQYREMARPSLVAHKAKPLVLRGKQRVVEGADILMVVVLEFDSLASAEAWYDSPEYQACKAFRAEAADMNVVMVEGVPQP